MHAASNHVLSNEGCPVWIEEPFSALQREHMLHQSTLPTQWAHGLLSEPLGNTLPAEHVAARRRGRVFHGFQAESALALLLAVDPAHAFIIGEVVAMRAAFATAVDRWQGRVGDAGEMFPLRLGIGGACRLEQERRRKGRCGLVVYYRILV